MRRFSLRSERGFTMVEVLVASVVLLIGIVGTLTLVQMAGGAANKAKTREGATNLARELLETARDSSYSQIGQTGWSSTTLQNMPGRTGNVTTPTAGTQQVSVARRGTTYTVTSKTCSVDDVKDGYGTHASTTTWCSDSTGQATNGDSQPEDLKRVIIDVDYTTRGVQQPTIEQVATFTSGGAAVGPQVTNLVMLTPTPVPPAAPVITTNPVSGNATFQATSVGSAGMTFTVNGVEQGSSSVVNNGSGNYTFTWPITALNDATYTIGAAAVDALGVRGASRTMTVKLARGAPVTPTNVTGGYNSVKVGGTATQVVELAWDANPEGSVTGYQVMRGAFWICGGTISLAITCTDLLPPSSGSSTYTIKTWYRDSANALQSVSTTYSVTAPVAGTAVPTVFGWVNTTTQIGYTPGCGTTGQGLGALPGKRDMIANFPTSGGVDSTVTGSPPGCGPRLPAGVTMAAGTATFSVWQTNTGTRASTVAWFLLHNNVAIGGTGAYTVPVGTTTPTKFTSTIAYPAQTIAAGDNISMYTNICSTCTMYFGSGAHQTTLSLPTLSGGSAGAPIPTPTVPTGLSGSVTSGITTLTWTAPASSNPAVDFYRVYRDGTNYTDRLDTTDATASTVATATAASATSVTVADATGFAAGQSVAVDTGANQDNMTVSSVSGNTITFSAGMARAHAVGVPVGLRTITWVDQNRGGTTHTYSVSSVSAALAESTLLTLAGSL